MGGGSFPLVSFNLDPGPRLAQQSESAAESLSCNQALRNKDVVTTNNAVLVVT